MPVEYEEGSSASLGHGDDKRRPIGPTLDMTEPNASLSALRAGPDLPPTARARASSALTTLRPKSAGSYAGGNRRILLKAPAVDTVRTTDDAERAVADGYVSAATSARSRKMYTKPRPPSASAALSHMRNLRRPRPHNEPLVSPNQGVHSVDHRVDAISTRILCEEIEAQRKVTRRAQREYNALRLQRTQKLQEIELLQRHLRAFDVGTYSPPKPGASTVGTGPLSRVDQLKDQIRRADAYKKTLRHMLDRLARQQQFLRANMEMLKSRHASATREWTLFQDKVAQERSLCAELDHKRVHLEDERGTHAQHAHQVLKSLREEVQSRSLVNQQRLEADRRREEMLRIVESRPPAGTGTGATASAAGSSTSLLSSSPPTAVTPSMPSHSRRDSFHLLLNESLNFFNGLQSTTGPAGPSSTGSAGSLSTGPAGPPSTTTSPFLSASTPSAARLRMHRRAPSIGENFTAALQRETFFQVYESQYERILERTGESDVGIVLDRYKSFGETRKRLQQIEKDLTAEHEALEAKRTVLQSHLQQLRLSGIAEVEKRKKIRDFLEQQHHIKSEQRVHAKEAFVEQLKSFAYVQQGILNITELLKCLDGNFSPPSFPLIVAGGVLTGATGPMVHKSVMNAAATTEIDWLQSLIYSCRFAARANPSPSVQFSVDQTARLAEIDPMLGRVANGFGAAWMPNVDSEKADPATVTPQEDCEDDGDDDSDDDSDDSSGEVEDRSSIKRSESETLQQVELLLRTLETRQQLARQEQSMQRLRRAFGLEMLEESSPSASPKKDVEPLDRAAKLAAVHAFFKEKRLREKHEQQQLREAQAAASELALSTTLVRRDSRPGSAAVDMSAAVATTQRRSTGGKSAASVALSAFSTAGKPPQRKRSNAVAFVLPLATQAQQPQLSSSVAKQPTRPPSSTPTIIASLRRPSNTTLAAAASKAPSSTAAPKSLLVRHQKR